MTTLPTIDAADWYETIRFADAITLVHEPWIPDFFRCNMWLIKGRDRDLLVDAGLGAVPLRGLVPALRDRPVTLLMSHTHFDHIGSAHEFGERLVHPAEEPIAADPTNAATLFDKYATGATDAEMFNATPPGWDARAYRITPAPATGTVVEGDRIDLGDRVWTVLHTPGHSPGHVSLFEEWTGTLIAQDAVYDGQLVDNCYHSDIDVYIGTMRRLRDMDPAIVHGGHGPSFGRVRFRQIIDGYLREKGVL
ncbi:MAG TPA: MBL fold metallo-hydrolase [Methylomirabilota bacterium]|nr:MBL fold metallo-hydrolase [Methylomirabilota bacterium]